MNTTRDNKITTRKDVANSANVSVATVSNVFNNTKYVSPEIKERVIEAAEALNYKPNHFAKMLNSEYSFQIGVMVDNLQNPFYGEIVEGINEVAAKNNYSVGLYIAENEFTQNVNQISERKMDGVIIFSYLNEEDNKMLELLHKEGIAILVGGAEHDFASTLDIDNRLAIEDTVRHLVELGHTRIAYLTGIPDLENDMRYVYYKKALGDFGIDYDHNLVASGPSLYDTTMNLGKKLTRSLLDKNADFTAVIAVNDLMALGAIMAIKEHGLTVPEDISVVGFDDIDISRHFEPQLTTVRVPKKEMGRIAMRMLINQIKHKKRESYSLDTELIIRKSTAVCK